MWNALKTHHYCRSSKSFIALMRKTIGLSSRAIIAFLSKVIQCHQIPEFFYSHRGKDKSLKVPDAGVEQSHASYIPSWTSAPPRKETLGLPAASVHDLCKEVHLKELPISVRQIPLSPSHPKYILLPKLYSILRLATHVTHLILALILHILFLHCSGMF